MQRQTFRHIESLTFHSKCRVHKVLNKNGEEQEIIEDRSAGAGRTHPFLFIHSFFTSRRLQGQEGRAATAELRMIGQQLEILQSPY